MKGSFYLVAKAQIKYCCARDDSISYTYDPDGLRTSKTVNGTTTKYHVMNGTLLGQTKGSDTIVFLYDEKANRYGFDYNGTKYYYIFNVQGDVIGILNQSGSQIVSYTYDAWGKVLSVSGSEAATIGQLNPIRYRGYYYDTETGFYYLQSRYYDPTTRRFLNADAVTDGSAGVIGNNLFIYVANNPVNNSDATGQWIIKDAIQWFVKKVVKPVVQKVKTTISKFKGTFTNGLYFNASPNIFSFSGQIGVSVDTSGNVAVQGTTSGGVTTGTAGISGGIFRMATNAPSVEKLEGTGYQLGGSANIPVPPAPISINAGGDFNLIYDKDENLYYYGTTQSVGVAPPIAGAEFHAEWGETYTLLQFNLFEVMDYWYIKIMEW